MSTRDEIGPRMKEYEAAIGKTFAGTLPYVVRLDGHCFHTYTKPFLRPYDTRITQAMIQTAMDLCESFMPMLVYVESDEITMIFPPLPQHQPESISRLSSASSALQSPNNADGEPAPPPAKVAKTNHAPPTAMFNGRVMKICTVLAGFCSARFNYHIAHAPYDKEDATDAKILRFLETTSAYFDARLFEVPSVEEAIANIKWRCKFDGQKNSKRMLAQLFFNERELNGLSADAGIRKVREKLGIAWSDLEGPFKFGAFVKREEYMKEALNPRTGESVLARRTRIAPRSFDFDGEDLDFSTALLFARTWNDVDSLFPGNASAAPTAAVELPFTLKIPRVLVDRMPSNKKK